MEAPLLSGPLPQTISCSGGENISTVSKPLQVFIRRPKVFAPLLTAINFASCR